MKADDDYPRIRDLPAHEREPFQKWLGEWRCTCPAMDGVPREEQDCYYLQDYVAWKVKRPPLDESDIQAEPSSLATLRGLLRQVFTSDAAVDEWLDIPDPSLGGLSPRAVASHPGGMQRVREIVLRMIHGIP